MDRFERRKKIEKILGDIKEANALKNKLTRDLREAGEYSTENIQEDIYFVSESLKKIIETLGTIVTRKM